MYSNQHLLTRATTKNALIFFIALLSLCINHKLSANESASLLFVKPIRCIALRQGQVCYQKITFNWRTEQTGSYCLYAKEQKEALKCWEQSSSGTYKMDFQSDSSTLFVLQNEKNKEVVANTSITVAWVYKSRKPQKSTWRLF